MKSLYLLFLFVCVGCGDNARSKNNARVNSASYQKELGQDKCSDIRTPGVSVSLTAYQYRSGDKFLYKLIGTNNHSGFPVSVYCLYDPNTRKAQRKF